MPSSPTRWRRLGTRNGSRRSAWDEGAGARGSHDARVFGDDAGATHAGTVAVDLALVNVAPPAPPRGWDRRFPRDGLFLAGEEAGDDDARDRDHPRPHPRAR